PRTPLAAGITSPPNALCPNDLEFEIQRVYLVGTEFVRPVSPRGQRPVLPGEVPGGGEVRGVVDAIIDDVQGEPVAQVHRSERVFPCAERDELQVLPAVIPRREHAQAVAPVGDHVERLGRDEEAIRQSIIIRRIDTHHSFPFVSQYRSSTWRVYLEERKYCC